MARQKGIIKLKGTIGDITFYKSGDGYMAREKGASMATELRAIPHSSEHVRTAPNSVAPAKRAKCSAPH